MSVLSPWLRGGWLRTVDHALAQSLFRLRPDTTEAVLLGAALASRALSFGHSALPLAQARELLIEIAPEGDAPVLPSRAEWRDALLASPWVAASETSGIDTPLVLESERLYLRRYWQYEHGLAQALRARAAPGIEASAPAEAAWREARLVELFPQLAREPDDAQAAAARRLLTTRLLLLTGGPGTGKTHSIAQALRLRCEHAQRAGAPPPRIALSAPTGKAAARLAEAVRTAWQGTRALSPAPRIESGTLHRLLGGRSDGRGFRHHASQPLPHDIVVVDEASMVDLALMYKLVDAVAPSASLLLVGDRDQLPAVDTGEVLAALCDSADAGGVLTAHRVALQRSWRQDATLDLTPLAEAVRTGETERALDGLAEARYRGVHWVAPRERTLSATVLEQALPAYRAVRQAVDPASALAAAREFRVLTALREGSSGSLALNALMAQALQAQLPRAERRSERHFHGALLIVTENSVRHGLYNGDVGLVWREADGALRVWFETETGLRAWSPAALPAHESAFALTVHKSQGSEFDRCLLVLPPAASGASRALTRELLYTGLTRGRRGLTLWADAEALRAAIARRAQRWSGLAERLR